VWNVLLETKLLSGQEEAPRANVLVRAELAEANSGERRANTFLAVHGVDPPR
jgi:hypothetical protein